MRNKNILAALILIVGGTFYSASAQTVDPMKPSLVTGDVKSVVPGSILLATKDGELKVVLSEKTEYKRVAAENPSLKTATAAALSDIAVGDRLAVTGVFGADRSSLPARAVYLMTKADITARHTKESEEWKTRGITGRRNGDRSADQRDQGRDPRARDRREHQPNAEGQRDHPAIRSEFDQIRRGPSEHAGGDPNRRHASCFGRQKHGRSNILC